MPNRRSLSRRVLLGGALCSLLLTPLLLPAAERSRKGNAEDAETVEMFSAMESGMIDVTIIPRDSTEAKIFIKNKTKKKLRVELPGAFVGVLAQPGGFGGGLGGGDPFGGGGNQQFGGGGGGQQGGFFQNIPAERVGEVKVPIVCLEHGKRDPHPRVKYEIKPVEVFSKEPELKAMLTLLGEGKYSQRMAQAAAWHIASDMSWEELAAKRIKRVTGQTYPYFSRREMYGALHMFRAADELAKSIKVKSPGEQSENK